MASTKTEISPLAIKALKPASEIADPAHPGLRVRGTSRGQTFFYRYRDPAGRLREIKLGEFGPLTLAEARKELARVKLARERGVDPQEEKRKARDAARRARASDNARAYTVEDLVEHYAREVLDRQKRGAEAERVLAKGLLPAVGSMPAVALTRAELQAKVIRPVMARHPRTATTLLSRTRCAYRHGIEQGRLPEDFVSPTEGIKGAAHVRRRRAFTDAELAVFLRWLPNSPYSRTVRDALRLVLLTGCRSGEVVAARWSDIDLERAVWTLRETKTGEPLDVMLSRQVVELFNFRDGLDAEWVFPSPRGKAHVAQKALGLAQYTARQVRGSGTAADPIELGWTVHDLRRSVATGLARLGCPRVVQNRILNHADASIAAIYDVHAYDAEAREWLQRWADHLDVLAAPKVVHIEAARKRA